MGTAYNIDFTDQNLNRRFDLAPSTTNGPIAPNDDTLHTKATDAATTLLLYGKGAPDYGERIQENMIHMVEHFASDVEPVYAIHGQLWYDRSTSSAQLRVFNAFKYEIVAADPPNDSMFQYFAYELVNSANALEEAEQLARFTTNTKVTLIESGTENTEKYSIASPGAILNGSSNIEFSVSPTPTATRVGWFIGGWEHVHQSNSVLPENWTLNIDPTDPSAWTLKNVRDPEAGAIGRYDVANRNYVDNVITGVNNLLSGLTDTNITLPASDDILRYNGSLWVNVQLTDAIVSTTSGGPMQTDLLMGGYHITGLPLHLYPDVVNPNHAASIGYVNSAISSISGSLPTLLDDLADVLAPTPVNNEILEFSGGQWRNITPASFIATNNIITTAGGTFTGDLFIPVNAITSNNQVPHKKYVDDEIALAVAVGGDGVINSLTFNPGTLVLTATTTTAATYNASLAGAGGTTSSVLHEIENPTDSADYPAFSVGHALENKFYDEVSYPFVALDRVVREYAIALGRFAAPKPRVVLTVDNITGPVVNLKASDLGATQAHAPIVGGDLFPYVAGQNRLMVWVNGVKQIADDFGVIHILGLDLFGGTEIGLWHGMETGLTPATDYNIDINVDGTGVTTYTVDSDDAYRLGDLLEALNVIGATATPAFSVMLYEGILHFFSGTSGTGSSIDVTNGTGGNPDLIAAIVGNAGTTGTIYIDLTQNIFNFVTPSDFSYKEGSTSDVALVGFESQSFTFNSTLPLGAIIEVLIELDIFNRG